MRIIVTLERDDLYELLNLNPDDTNMVIFAMNYEFSSVLDEVRSNIMPFHYIPDMFSDKQMEELFLTGIEEYANENSLATIIVTANEKDYDQFIEFMENEESLSLQKHTVEYVSLSENQYELNFFTYILIWYENNKKSYWVRNSLFEYLGNLLTKERELLSTSKDVFIDNSETGQGTFVGYRFDPRNVPTSKN